MLTCPLVKLFLPTVCDDVFVVGEIPVDTALNVSVLDTFLIC